MVDIYQGDGDFNLGAVAKDPAWIGVMLKATQGTYYSGGDWLATMHRRAQTLCQTREDWYVIPYHYMDMSQSGSTQATFFFNRLRQVALGSAIEPPVYVFDVERGGQRGTYSRMQIIDQCSLFVKTMKKLTRKPIVCYGGEYLRSNRIKLADMDVDLGWVAEYSAQLDIDAVVTPLGITPSKGLFAWQYAGLQGGGQVDVHLKGYPWTSPAGKADISAIVMDGGGDAAKTFLRSLM